MKLLVALTVCILGIATVSAAYPNPITDDELVSVVTSSIDGYFYKVGSDVGTDKVSNTVESDSNFPRPVGDLCKIVGADALILPLRYGITDTTTYTASCWHQFGGSPSDCLRLVSVGCQSRISADCPH